MTDDSFHRPLCRKRGRSNVKCLGDKVDQRVNALVNKVKACGLLLIVENLELHNPLEKIVEQAQFYSSSTAILPYTYLRVS